MRDPPETPNNISDQFQTYVILITILFFHAGCTVDFWIMYSNHLCRKKT